MGTAAALSRRLALGAALAAALWAPAPAGAVGGSYVVSGGTPRQQAQVRLALDASAFDWSLLPQSVHVTIARGVEPQSLPGRVWLNAALLDAGMFSWAVVQDEFAHQVDYLLLRAPERQLLNRVLGGRAWCYDDVPGLAHGDYGCERFTSTFVWAYWPVRENPYRPRSARDESAALDPRRFRSLLESLLPASRAARVPLSRALRG